MRQLDVRNLQIKSKIQMSFNRTNTGRLSGSVSSVKSQCQQAHQENIKPSILLNQRQGTTSQFSNRSSSTKNQNKSALTTVSCLERGGGIHHPLQELPNLKSRQNRRQISNSKTENAAHKSQQLTFGLQSHQKDQVQQQHLLKTNGLNPLSLQVSLSHLDNIQDGAASQTGPVDNFDMIRQLISPVAEDTKNFLEQVSLQLRNMSKQTTLDKNSHQNLPSPTLTQSENLKALDLSCISHGQQHQYLSSHSDEVFPADGSEPMRRKQGGLIDDSSYLADLSTENVNKAAMPTSSDNAMLLVQEADLNSDRIKGTQDQIHAQSQRIQGQDSRSLWLNLMNQHKQLQNQFDYASLIDHRKSLNQFHSSSHHSFKSKRTDDAQTFSDEEPQPRMAQSTKNVNSKHVACFDLAKEPQQEEQNLDSEQTNQQQTTSRFKNQKTASVATFGQQGGNLNTIGATNSCMSPSTLSPPTQLAGYWKMEEKPVSGRKISNLQQQQRQLQQVISMKKKTASIVSKFIDSAFERQNKTTRLSKPVLNQKRVNTLASHQSLRISTQPSECLSNRSRMILPNSTQSVASQLNLQSTKAKKRVFQSTFKRFQTESFQSELQSLTPKDSQQAEKKASVKRQPRQHMSRKSSQSAASRQRSESSAGRSSKAAAISLSRKSQQQSIGEKQTSQPQCKGSSGTFSNAGMLSVKGQKQAIVVKARIRNNNQNSLNLLHSQPSKSNKVHKTTKSSRSLAAINRLSRPKSPMLSDKGSTSTTQRLNNSSKTSRPLSKQSRHKGSQQASRKANSRPSSQLSCKSPAIPELELSKSSVPLADLNEDLGKFIDQTEDDADEPALANLRKFQTKLVYVGSKIEYYSRQVTIRKIREFSQHERPQSTAFLKAGRSLCLLLKAFTSMDESFRQVKEDELFADWTKIQQYLNSAQGEKQIKQLCQLRSFCELHSKYCDKKALLVDLRNLIFKYTLDQESQNVMNIDLESPRVKTAALKPIFCLAFFTMTFVTLQEQILENLSKLDSHPDNLKEEGLEQQLNSPLKQSFSDSKNQSIGLSPDVKVANIAINATTEQRGVNSSQATAQIQAPSNDSMQLVTSNSLDNRNQTQVLLQHYRNQSLASVINCLPGQAIQNNNCVNDERIQTSASPLINHTQRMDMFGSHFKPGCQAFEETSRPIFPEAEKVSGVQELIDYNTSQPISSIGDPQSSSFLQQSNCEEVFTVQSHYETQMSGNSSQVGGHPTQLHLSTDAGQSSIVQDANSSIGGVVGNGIVKNPRLDSIATLQQQLLTGTQGSQQTSEFTFYQSQNNNQNNFSLNNRTSTASNLTSQCPTPSNRMQAFCNQQSQQALSLVQCTEPDSPTWEDKKNVPEANSPSMSECQKMTDILNQRRDQDGINVNELLQQIKSKQAQESQLHLQEQFQLTEEEDQASQLTDCQNDKNKLQHLNNQTQINANAKQNSVERAFEQFYTTNQQESSYDFQATTADETTLINQAQQHLSDNEILVYDKFSSPQQLFEWSEEHKELLLKQNRSSLQILSSIKKRRKAQNEECRVKGSQLGNLADQIIEECRFVIENSAYTTIEGGQTPRCILEEHKLQEEVMPERILFENQTRDQQQVMQCLLSKGAQSASNIVTDNSENKKNQNLSLTPETPPFTGMKRVFGSTEFKRASPYDDTDAGQKENIHEKPHESDQINLVLSRIPTNNNREDEQFKTLEANQPTHIEEIQGGQSGRQFQP